ncbi:MAG: hypothetical protein ACRC67_17295 [Inquilinus sp.]|uniref:hypothetical protein n=1 Tax=Inquilinus sp. TaxID=1932117 RepID=UPI003F321B43
MVFAGSRISAPAMAAAQGMKDMTLHQATNKSVRPLMAHPATALKGAGSLPVGLTELTGAALPTAPDLVPFPTVPPARIARFAGLPSLPGASLPGAALPQAPAATAPQALADPAGATQARTAAEGAARRRPDLSADPVAATTGRPAEKPAAPDPELGPAEPPRLPDKAAEAAFDEVTRRLPRVRPASR